MNLQQFKTIVDQLYESVNRYDGNGALKIEIGIRCLKIGDTKNSHVMGISGLSREINALVLEPNVVLRESVDNEFNKLSEDSKEVENLAYDLKAARKEIKRVTTLYDKLRQQVERNKDDLK